MRIVQTKEQAPKKPLREWPGVVIVLLQLGGWFGAAILSPDFTAYGVLAGVVGGLAVVGWWLFFSRAGWYERLGVLVLMIAAMAATWPFLDVSISTGAMGFLFPMLAMPGLCVAFVLWTVASRRMSVGLQRATLVVAIVLACGVWTLVRTGGFTGSFDNDLAWRWTATPEQRLLEQGGEFSDSAPRKALDSAQAEVTPPALVSATPITPDDPAAAPAARPFNAVASRPRDLATDKPATAALDWPGFRGRDRFHFLLQRGHVADDHPVDGENHVAVGQVRERRPAAFAHRFDEDSLFTCRHAELEAIHVGNVASAELEIRVLVLLHFPWEPRRAFQLHRDGTLVLTPHRRQRD